MGKTRVGIDTGGTFTDFSCLDMNGKWRRWKTLSTPEDPSRSIMEGIKSFIPDIPHNEIEMVHGTTVGTNAFLERKGARTMLLTTAGFEDLFFIGRQARPFLYALMQQRPRPILDPDMTVGVSERMNHKGEAILPLQKSEAMRIRDICIEKQPESVAICLLHSYINPEHEKLLATTLGDIGVPICLSSEVMPEFREYERTSTTLINAYLGPVVGNYIKRLQTRLKDTKIFVQQSNGGCCQASNTGKYAVQTLLSGPAGGVQAALELGKNLGFKDIITFDMGGTSTDVSLCPGSLTYTRDYKIEGFPVSLPFIDIHTVGAGGGSVAWIDRGGLLKVGPDSAGADPGPVCYGKGERITVTDANLFLGRLRADNFLAGRMTLDTTKTAEAMKKLALSLEMNAVDTAQGIVKLVNINMVQAIRAVSVERGYDPRDFTLVSFGGAAGMHALEIADELGIKNVIIPDNAGIFSARGMSQSDIVFEKSQALILTVKDQRSENALAETFSQLKNKLKEEVRNHYFHSENITYLPTLDARYAGQSHELTIPWTISWKDLLHETHTKMYGYSIQDADIEITAIRIKAVLAQETEIKELQAIKKTGTEKGTTTEKETIFTEINFKDRKLTVPLIYKKDMEKISSYSNPCLIIDNFTTVLVPEGWKVKIFKNNLILDKSN